MEDRAAEGREPEDEGGAETTEGFSQDLALAWGPRQGLTRAVMFSDLWGYGVEGNS